MLRYVVPSQISSKKNNNYSVDKTNNNRGFTLAEMLIAAVVVGVLAAVTIPGFVGLMSKNQVQESANIIKAALQEIQKEAMAKSINCELTVNGTSRTITASAFVASYVGSTETINYVSGNCLNNTYSLNNTISLTTNGTSGTPGKQMKVRYSYKGNATSETTNTDAVIVVFSTSSPEKKCLIVPDGIGIIRTGTYSSTMANSAEPSSCSAE